MRKLLAAMLCAAAACGSSGGKGNDQQTVATPAFTPAGGTYAAPQTVTITCATAGATIRYTTDGTAPTASSPAYSGPVGVSTTGTTFKAYATLSGYTDSAVATATYVLQAAAPTFSPAAGTYAVPQSVTLATTTPGAAIHYTTDGTTPTGSSPTSSTPISVTAASTTIKALATRSGFADSAVASATYVINAEATPTATPTFSPAAGTYATVQNVAISSATTGATIYYTTSGADPTTASSVYAAPIAVSSTTTVKAMATHPAHTPSAIASAAYVINLPQAAAPTFAPPAGTYTSAQSVAIATTTPGATIYYTTSGADPTTASAVYSAPVAVSATTTLKAMATAPGFTASAVATALYTITAPQPVATPTFSPAPGTYTSAQSVTISCATVGATIHYTTNGADPTTGSAVYSAPIAISATTTLKAMAAKAGLGDSAIASGTYAISAGTDFATLCAAANTSSKNLLTTCFRWNPVVADALAGSTGIPCAEISRHFPSLLAYDAVQGQACVAGYQALTCDDVSPAAGNPTPAACDAAVVGLVATNGTCYDSLDCAAGYCTVDVTLSCPGTCQPFVPAGGSCPGGVECAKNLECNAGTCQAVSALNGPCPCSPLLWCDTSGGGAGVCRALKKGGSCATSAECAAGYTCVDVDPSAVTDLQCTAKVGAGGSCALGSDLCGLGYSCTAGTCVAWPTLGQTCSLVPGCAGSRCDLTSHTCVALKGLGESCISLLECASGNCNSATHLCTLGYCVMP
jgi:hypothetical protein